MPIPDPHPYFTVTAKDPAKQYVADVMQVLLDKWMESDEWRDQVGMPRKGREPDYIHGRWCIHCHNALPEDWGIKSCDVCGGATGSVSLNGLEACMGDEDHPITSTPYYGGIKRNVVKWAKRPGDPEKFPE